MNFRKLPSLLLVLVLAVPTCSQLAIADSAQEVVLTNGKRFDAKVVRVSQQVVRFVDLEGDTADISSSEFVRWGSPLAPGQRPRILLRDGSTLVAAPVWTPEGSIQLADEQFIVELTPLDKMQIPQSTVTQILFEAARDNDLAERLPAVLPDGELDELWLVSGDKLRGEVAAIKNGRVMFSTGGDSLEVELDVVSAIRFAGHEVSAPENAKLAVGFKDGSLLFAEQLTIDDGRVRVTLPTGLELAGRQPQAVTFLQSLGEEIVYLSDLEPIDYRHTPYFDLRWEYARDHNLFEGPLVAGDRRRLKGLAMHSASRLVYRLDSPFERFECEVAIDDSVAGNRAKDGGQGSVVFRVLVARQGGFEPAYASPVVRGGDPPRSVTVDVEGARAIALVVEHADHGDRQDHALWLDARLTP